MISTFLGIFLKISKSKLYLYFTTILSIIPIIKFSVCDIIKHIYRLFNPFPQLSFSSRFMLSIPLRLQIIADCCTSRKLEYISKYNFNIIRLFFPAATHAYLRISTFLFYPKTQYVGSWFLKFVPFRGWKCLLDIHKY